VFIKGSLYIITVRPNRTQVRVMRKIRVVLILSAGVLTAICFWAVVRPKADEGALMPNDNQVLNDEGYGNADAEYYNSEDDRVNDEEVSAIGNDAQ
jgi:hypothetical protein